MQKILKHLSLVKHIKDIDVTVTHNENEAVLLECNLIKKHRPRYNVLLRDDKSYPYILITHQHPYPRIDFYRGPRKKNGLYFGPYPSSLAVRETISLFKNYLNYDLSEIVILQRVHVLVCCIKLDVVLVLVLT